jgi:hypothetical protein
MVSGISSIHIFKYSGSSWSLLRTVSVAEGLISYEDIKINYDASRILKYDWFQASNATSYDNLLTYSHYYTPSGGNVLRYPYLSPRSKMMKCL